MGRPAFKGPEDIETSMGGRVTEFVRYGFVS